MIPARSMRSFVLLCVLLAAPTASAQISARASALHYDVPNARPGQRGAPAFEHRAYGLSVRIDGDEGLEINHSLDLLAAPRSSMPEWLPVAVLDQAAGDRCDVIGNDSVEVETRLLPAPAGYDFLGSPAVCAMGPMPSSMEPPPSSAPISTTVVAPHFRIEARLKRMPASGFS